MTYELYAVPEIVRQQIFIIIINKCDLQAYAKPDFIENKHSTQDKKDFSYEFVFRFYDRPNTCLPIKYENAYLMLIRLALSKKVFHYSRGIYKLLHVLY